MNPSRTDPPAYLLTIHDRVARVTLNVPERLNAVSEAVLNELTVLVSELDARPDVRVIALTGAGKGFCSGAELGSPSSRVDVGILRAAAGLVQTMIAASTPVVALVNGVAAGAGCSLAAAADYAIAAESAAFALTFSRIGLMPDAGATALLAASIGRARALRMAITGEKVSARDAFEWGLIAEVVPDDEFGGRCQELLASLATSATSAIAASVAAVNAATLDLDAALTREEVGQIELLGSANFAEGVTAFVEKRSPRFE